MFLSDRRSRVGQHPSPNCSIERRRRRSVPRKVRKIRFTEFRGRAYLAPVVLGAVLASGLVAGAQTAPPSAPPIVPGSLSGSATHSPQPGAPNAASPAPPPAAGPQPSPGPTTAPTLAPNRFHLHRAGTDVDGDLLIGNAASDAYVFRGNVVLRSDPKVDRSFAGATESDEPITVTADEIDVDRGGMSYVAKGNVHFVQGSRSGHADIGMLNEQTANLDLLGNADVRDGDQRVVSAKMHYNIADRQFHGAGNVRIYEPAPTPNPRPSTTPAPKRRRRLPL